MKKFLFAATAALFLCTLPAMAANRVMVYGGQNPDTNETNQVSRFQRLADGTFYRDALGAFGISGAWSNLNVVGGSGLNVTVNLATATQLAALYQFQPDDATAVPPTCPGAVCESLNSDSTQIIVQATQNGNSGTIGPFTAPGSGDQVYYLIEAQINTIDNGTGSSQSLLFVSTSGTTSFITVNTQRQDVIVYQDKAGTPAGIGTASPPPVDSGWISIATVELGHTAANCSTDCTITMTQGTNFTGNSFGYLYFGGAFAQNGDISPTKLTTHGNSTPCGLGNGGGYLFQNSGASTSVGNLLAGDLSGDQSICGNFLNIFANGGGSVNAQATLIFNDVIGNQDTFYPSHGHVSTYASMGCATQSFCAASPYDACPVQNGANYIPNAYITISDANNSPPLLWQTFYEHAAPQAGVFVQFYNPSTSTAFSGNIAFEVTCF